MCTVFSANYSSNEKFLHFPLFTFLFYQVVILLLFVILDGNSKRYIKSKHGPDACNLPFISNSQTRLAVDNTTIDGTSATDKPIDAGACKFIPVTSVPDNSTTAKSQGGGASSVHMTELTLLVFTAIGLFLRLL